MTTNDKTRQKLVESMRKTKAPTTKKSTAAASKNTKSTSDSNSHKKNVNKATKKSAVKDNAQLTADPYRSRGRIWPD